MKLKRLRFYCLQPCVALFRPAVSACHADMAAWLEPVRCNNPMKSREYFTYLNGFFQSEKACPISKLGDLQERKFRKKTSACAIRQEK